MDKNEYDIQISKKRNLNIEEEIVLSKNLSKEYKEIFDIIDFNGDGRISVEELEIAFNAVGIDSSNEEIKALFAKIDENGDDFIDFKEFLSILSLVEDPDPNELRKMFKKFDTDNSGGLNCDELIHGIKSLNIGILDEELKEVVEEIDFDENSEISYDRFVEMMMEN
ncbi:centrin, EF-hand protein, variant 2 [Bonamia ostreae]|uniref:Centrin, EF-hand protein, variant 2 n=1 Tax=Bonamia ostreae TaxID=126728 RepID=A0ABV2ANL7_9EUKA